MRPFTRSFQIFPGYGIGPIAMEGPPIPRVLVLYTAYDTSHINKRSRWSSSYSGNCVVLVRLKREEREARRIYLSSSAMLYF
jgi:hypothetical protein